MYTRSGAAGPPGPAGVPGVSGAVGYYHAYAHSALGAPPNLMANPVTLKARPVELTTVKPARLTTLASPSAPLAHP